MTCDLVAIKLIPRHHDARKLGHGKRSALAGTSPDSYRDLPRFNISTHSLHSQTNTNDTLLPAVSIHAVGGLGDNSLIARPVRNNEIGTNANHKKHIFNKLQRLR
jgi:hypothetical protein